MTMDELDTVHIHLTLGGYEVQLWPPSWALLIVGGVAAIAVLIAILTLTVLATRLSFHKRD